MILKSYIKQLFRYQIYQHIFSFNKKKHWTITGWYNLSTMQWLLFTDFSSA